MVRNLPGICAVLRAYRMLSALFGPGQTCFRALLSHSTPSQDWIVDLASNLLAAGFFWRVVMASGTVKWFNAQKGFGFIQPDDGSKDVFVHISAVERANLGRLNEGQKIKYEVQRGQQGKVSAENLQAE